MRVSIEALYRVYNDDDGTYVEVGEDGDGLGLVELRYCERSGKVTERFSVPVEMATLVASAIRDVGVALAKKEPADDDH